ncbi:hypothetical protein F8M41_008783 [Gigaspora margarita]|uniref:Uncharacterized protein n=1 Tax=Gigaspora margarita TaxID=4874 RepID=A0A8H4AVM2_GIGMA|nr:hypothetical protein F8M41_008783 [Gigaspora margarita]
MIPKEKSKHKEVLLGRVTIWKRRKEINSKLKQEKKRSEKKSKEKGTREKRKKDETTQDEEANYKKNKEIEIKSSWESMVENFIKNVN